MTDIIKVRVFLEKSISAMEELLQYRKLGTLEELQALKEKQIPKKPVLNGTFLCPGCGGIFVGGIINKKTVYCGECGQAVAWNELSET